MNVKIKALIKNLLLLAAVLIFCFGLSFLFDVVFNGFLVDWLDSHFTSYYGTIPRTDWRKLILLLFMAFCLMVFFIIFLIRAISRFRAKRASRNALGEASRLMRIYMTEDRDATELFPKEYAEISAQITEIKATMQRHEQILREEASRKNDLITYLAHDLKTPLTSVIGYLSLLEEAPEMPDKQKAKYTHITLEKAQRLERLINEFFDITRYNLQEISLEKETVDLYYMLVQMTDEFYPILSAHQNTIDLKADENLTIFADPEKLARVFNNILKNAVAYSYPGTPITVRAEQRKNEICISFENHGKTIPWQKLDSIFEKFYRLDDARSTNTGGAGLGLAIAREIVRLHGGNILAKSEAELTTFLVTLPI